MIQNQKRWEFETKPNPAARSSDWEKQRTEEDKRELPRFEADQRSGGGYNNRGCDACLLREEQRCCHEIEENACLSERRPQGARPRRQRYSEIKVSKEPANKRLQSATVPVVWTASGEA